MFADPEAEIPRLAEIAPLELVLFDFEPALEDFFRFGPANGDVDGDFLVAADAEGTDGEACFTYLPPNSR